MNQRRLFKVCLMGLALFACVRVYFRLTDDFRLANIRCMLPFHQEWEIPTPTAQEKQQIEQIFNQTFTYAKKGAQSYVFVSEDGNYVLKFFKFKHVRPSPFVQVLSSLSLCEEYCERAKKRKKRKLEDAFIGYRLAYGVHKDESGLLFVQLNPPGSSGQQFTLRDKLGFTRLVDRGEVPFILQKCGTSLRDHLEELIQHSNLSLVETRIGQIFTMYRREYAKGIFDHDHGVMRNTGFAGEKAIHFDVGKLKLNEEMRQPAVCEEDLVLVAQNMKNWFASRHPELSSHFFAVIDEKLTTSHP